jgi:DNA-binding LytR/AlgR family response regulator
MSKNIFEVYTANPITTNASTDLMYFGQSPYGAPQLPLEVKLNTNDIYFIEALKDYVVINTIDTRYTIHSTMKEIEAKMGSIDFIRIHRSFIVRLDKIATIEFPNLTLENDKKSIPIGGSYRDDLNAKIKLL